MSYETLSRTDWSDWEYLWEDFSQSANSRIRRGNLKKKAVRYMKKDEFRNGLTRKVIRHIIAKSRKIRRSARKADRAIASCVARQAGWYMNLHKK
jgi:hypothetical protein